MKKISKYVYLLWFGGSLYITMEVIWRGYSHWTMGLLGGVVFILIGLLNEIWGWETSLILQVLIGTVVATMSEFVAGCILNLWLNLAIWDYSSMWGNLLGQICPQFILLWIPISLLAITLDDLLRWKFFGEEKPKYKL